MLFLEKQKLSLALEQQKTKPQIEDVFNELLEGDKLRLALGFVEYLRGMKMHPRWYATNAWKINFKGKFFLSIRVNGKNGHTPIHYGLEPGSWHVGHWGQGDFVLPDDMGEEFGNMDEYLKFKEYVWANVQKCKMCGCCKGRNRTYFGKVFENTCNFRIEDPDAEGIEQTKKLLEYKKKIIFMKLSNPDS